jgi:hypothetical protein
MDHSCRVIGTDLHFLAKASRRRRDVVPAAPVHVTIRRAVACRPQPAELAGLADEERGVLAVQRRANRIAPDGADTA